MMIDYIALATTVSGFLTSPYNYWAPVAFAAAIAVIGLLAAIMMISAMIGRERMRVWAKVKIYDVVFSVMLIFVFFVIIGLLSSINFQTQVFGPLNLVPNECSGSSSIASGGDLMSLAVCDMYTFNQNVVNLNTNVYLIALRMSFFPQTEIGYTSVLGVQGVGVSTKINPSLPAFETATGYMLDALYTAFTISQLQLLILAAALLLFSVLMSIGIISRIFVVTRSFGGSLIALAIGLGIIYPLMVCITYGYINVGIDNTGILLWIATPTVLVFGVVSLLIALILGGTVASGILVPFIQLAGYVGVGLVLVPLLNLLIVDVFVIDFSQAVGERMDFMSLLANLI